MKSAQLSIILPVYNVEKYISRALQSCIDQSFKDIEIIVVDDCGQDKSMDIAYKFARRDHRIKIVHNKKNLKLLRARYQGAQAASAEYIMFLDSDDFLDTSICEKIARVNKQYADLDLLCFGMLTQRGQYFAETNGCCDIRGGGIDSLYTKDSYCDFILKNDKCHWNLCGKVLKKSTYFDAFERLGSDISINMAEDALIYFYMFFNVSTIYLLNQKGYFYCENAQSLSKAPDVQKMMCSLAEEAQVIALITQGLKTIEDRKFYHFSKAMRRDLLYYHRHRKWMIRKLIHKDFFSRNFFKGIYGAEVINYKLYKKMRKIL